jgi:hypothetical protein
MVSLKKLKDKYQQSQKTEIIGVSGFINHLCYNYMSVHGHREVIAEFFCPYHMIYICSDCFEEHKDDIGEFGRADSTKNHLAKLFMMWSSLLDHAKKKTILQLKTNLEKHKTLIAYLKKRS